MQIIEKQKSYVSWPERNQKRKMIKDKKGKGSSSTSWTFFLYSFVRCCVLIDKMNVENNGCVVMLL